jgi:hypothetical protein
MKQIKKINIKKATERDGISVKILKIVIIFTFNEGVMQHSFLVNCLS